MGFGSLDPRELARLGRGGGGMSHKQRSRVMRGASAAASQAFATRVIGDKAVLAKLEKLDEKVKIKIVANGIKPLVRMVKVAWINEFRSAKSSGRASNFRRKYGGVSLRAALAKSVKGKNPKGITKMALRGYVTLGGGTTKHGKRGTAVSNAGQAMWLEYGTKAHDLGKGSSTARGVQLGGGRHPGMAPMTKVRARMTRMRPAAMRILEAAIKMGLDSGGENTVKTTEQKQLIAKFTR